MKLWYEFAKGLIKENPTFRLVLGMCPTLAVTTSVENGIGMGLATTAVLFGSNAVISSIRNIVPAKVRIPCYIIIITGLTTVIEMSMQAFFPALFKQLGIFIPLIAVNCIILGRAEAFAARNSVLPSIADGVGMGLGFTLALGVVSLARELAGHATLLAILPPGGFIILGLILASINRTNARLAVRRGAPVPPSLTLDCRHCTLCDFGKKTE